MRASYLTYLWKKMKRGELSALPRQAARFGGTWLSRRIGRPLAGPMNGCIVATYRCNLSCRMCDLNELWNRGRDRRDEVLSTAEMKALVDDYAAIGTTGVSFTGGEPILRSDVLDVIHHAGQRGLVTHMSTNGYLMDRELAREILGSGLDAIAFSIDGATARTHDTLRGVEGSFERAVQGLEHFAALRRETASDTSVLVVCMINRLNLDEIMDLAELTARAGADYLSFIPFHDIGRLRGGDEIMSDLRIAEADLPRMDALMNELIAYKKRTGRIDTSIEYLKLFKNFFRDEPLPLECYAGYVTMVVDEYGDMFPCFPYMEMGRPGCNIRRMPLREYWRSEELNRMRKEIRDCRKCYWNNQTETSLMFQSLFARQVTLKK